MPIDPSTFATPADFSAALTRLREQQGKAVRAVTRETGIPTATLGGYFSGRHLPPLTQPESLAALLASLGVDEEQVPQWREALGRVRRIPGPRQHQDASPYRGLESFDLGDVDLFFGRDALSAQVGEEVEAARPGRERLVSLVGASGSGKSSLLRAGLLGPLAARGQLVAVLSPGAAPLAALEAVLPSADAAQNGDRSSDRSSDLVLGVDQFEEVFDSRVSTEERLAFLTRLTELATDPDSATVVVIAVRADFFGRCMEEPLLLPLLRQHTVLVGPMDDAALRAAIVEPAVRRGREVEPALVDLVLRDVAPRLGSDQQPALPLLSHAMLSTWKRSQGKTLSASEYLAAGGVAGAIQTTAEQVWASLDDEGQGVARRLFAQLATVDQDGLVTRRRTEHADLADLDDPAVLEAFVANRILTATETTLEISHEVLLEAWPRLKGWIVEDEDALRVVHRVGQAARAWDQEGRDKDGLLRGLLLNLATTMTSETRAVPVTLAAVERDFVEQSQAQEHRRRYAERRGQRRLKTLFVSVVVLALGLSFLSAYLVEAVGDARAERRDADFARDSALSRQVAISATDLGATEPALAARLALAAYRISPTVEARSALLDATTRAQTTRLLSTPGSMRAIYSPDGTTLAVVYSDSVVRFFTGADRDAAPTPAGEVEAAENSGELYAAAYSPDGRLLAVGGSGGVITVYDVSDPTHPVAWPKPLTGPASAVQGMTFNADGTELAAATSDPALFRWAFEGDHATPLPTTTGFDGSNQSVAYTRAGLIATGSSDGAVRLWRARADGSLRLLSRVPVGTETTYVFSVAFNPAGTLLAAGSKGDVVRVWHVTPDGQTKIAHAPLGGFTSQVNSVTFSHDGRRLAGVASGGAGVVWDTATWQQAAGFAGPANFTSVEFSRDDSRVLTGAIDGTTRIHQVGGPTPVPFGDTLWSLGFPGDGQSLYVGVGAAAPSVAVLDTTDPRDPQDAGRRFVGPDGDVLDGVMTISPDGKLLVGGTGTGKLFLWHADQKSDQPFGSLADNTALIENAVFSPDGHWFAASSDDGHVTVYDATATPLPTLVTRIDAKSLPIGLAFNPQGTLVAITTADHKVSLYSVDAKGGLVGAVDEFENYGYSAAFSPDGKTLVAGSADKTIRMWDVTDPTAPKSLGDPLRGPADTIFGLAFADGGQTLAAASSDGALWLWHLDGSTWSLWARLRAVGGEVYNVAVDPRGGAIAGGGSEGRMALWMTDPQAAADWVCRSTGSPVSESEWHDYVPGASYADPCPA